MSRNPLHHRLIEIVEPVLTSSGFELVDLRFVLEQSGWTLRVQVDRPLPARTPGQDIDLTTDRVDLTACEQLSRELSAVLDVNDPIPQAYSLEVSSPGIERPLRTAAHFAYFAGSEARISLAVPLQIASADASKPAERRNFRGVLKGFADGRVVIECDGQTYQLPLADIDSAKLVADWDAVMHGGSGVSGQPPQKPTHKPQRPQRQPRQKER
jgi:ribosome maturation factor RimP